MEIKEPSGKYLKYTKRTTCFTDWETTRKTNQSTIKEIKGRNRKRQKKDPLKDLN